MAGAQGADGPKSASAVRFSKFDFGNKPVVIPGMPLKASATTSGKPVSKPDKHGLLKQVRERAGARGAMLASPSSPDGPRQRLPRPCACIRARAA